MCRVGIDSAVTELDSVEEAVREELISGDGSTGTVVDERVDWS